MGSLCLPQLLSKEGEQPIELGLQALGNLWVLLSKLLEVVVHVRKKAKLGVQKVNSGQDICNRTTSDGNGKNCEKPVQSSKGIMLVVLLYKTQSIWSQLLFANGPFSNPQLHNNIDSTDRWTYWHSANGNTIS